MSDEETKHAGMTRLAFIKASAGAAAGVAAINVPGAAAAARDEEAGVATSPSTRTPREPVVAYVRSAKHGEVTIVSGTHETTYRDRALVRRLLRAARRHSKLRGGGKDVLAS
jgi:hypothetical protein